MTQETTDTAAMRRMHPNDVGAKDLDRWADEIDRLRCCTNPRFWTAAMHDAWHQHIPDTHAAFAAVEEASRAR